MAVGRVLSARSMGPGCGGAPMAAGPFGPMAAGAFAAGPGPHLSASYAAGPRARSYECPPPKRGLQGTGTAVPCSSARTSGYPARQASCQSPGNSLTVLAGSMDTSGGSSCNQTGATRIPAGPTPRLGTDGVMRYGVGAGSQKPAPSSQAPQSAVSVPAQRSQKQEAWKCEVHVSPASSLVHTGQLRGQQPPPSCSTQSTQSLPSSQCTSGCNTAMNTGEMAGSGSRAPSAGLSHPAAAQAPGSAAGATTILPAATTPQPPGPDQHYESSRDGSPRTGYDSAVLREKLERIQQEVRNVALMQRHSEELEQTRQRVSQMESTIQIQQKETQEAREQREELCRHLEEKDRRMQELEQRLQQSSEECARTKKDLAQAVLDFNSAIASKERLEAEQHANRSSQEHAEQLRRRCEELERSEQELLEQVQRQGSQHRALEVQAAEAVQNCEDIGGRLSTATEAARRIEGEKRLLESELERVRQQQRDSEQLAQESGGRAALLEEKLRELQDRRHREDQDKKGAEQELQQWYQKCMEAERGNAGTLRQNQELRRDLLELSIQMKQEQSVANICSPGELLSLMKAHEDESLAVSDGRLKKQLTKTQCELELCLRKLGEQEALLRNLQSGQSC